jgi:DNA-binding MltR family transcriptional regulator
MLTDNFDSFVEGFLEEKTERSLIILGAAKIDNQLLLILTKHLPSKNGKDDLLIGDNPISTFSSRIKLIHRLGIIDDSLVGISNQVKEVRNLCAHDLSIKKASFHDRIVDLRKRLVERQSFRLTKTRYFGQKFNTNLKDLQCVFITIFVVLEAILENTVKTSGIDTTLKISIKLGLSQRL